MHALRSSKCDLKKEQPAGTIGQSPLRAWKTVTSRCTLHTCTRSEPDAQLDTAIGATPSRTRAVNRRTALQGLLAELFRKYVTQNPVAVMDEIPMEPTTYNAIMSAAGNLPPSTPRLVSIMGQDQGDFSSQFSSPR